MKAGIPILALLFGALLAASGHADWRMRVHRGQDVTEFDLAEVDSITFQPPEEPGWTVIPAGAFLMGAEFTEAGSENDERPVHSVVLTHAFELQATEVTNAQFIELAQWAVDNGHATVNESTLRDALDGSTVELLDLDAGNGEIAWDDSGFHLRDVGHGINPKHPVKEVTWHGAAAYCDWLSLREGLPRAYDHATWECGNGFPYAAEGYRLPTEAEWEYACRAGVYAPFNTGECLDAGTEANYNGELPYVGCPAGPLVGWTVDVASYPANAWGVHDAHGNVLEWCNDWYAADYYGANPGIDPPGPADGVDRVCRGGSRAHDGAHCRSAERDRADPTASSSNLSFRPAITSN